MGSGASSRSAGSLGHVPKAGLTDLKARYGESVAHRVYAEAREAREYVETLVREHQIECGLRTSGRFIAAHSPKAYAKLRDYLIRMDDDVTCKSCSKRFEIPSHQSMVFLDEQGRAPTSRPAADGDDEDDDNRGNRA